MADQKALKEREARRQEQARFEEVYEDVRAELLQIPGVVEVGIGLRERGGALTDEPAFRVYVEEKRPLPEIPKGQRIPAEIGGLATDVLRRIRRIPRLGFNDTNYDRNDTIKVGGSQIGINGLFTGVGTLGCFARLTSDNSVVLLGNHHVLMQRGAGNGVGQPDYSGLCCCICNEIATTIASPSGHEIEVDENHLDCAIARLKPGVKFTPRIRQIKRKNGSIEVDGLIRGSDPAVVGDEVWKVGRTTGLTRGKVKEVRHSGDVMVILEPLPPFKSILEEGDSGSVVVEVNTSKVVALLHSSDETDILGLAAPIGPVTTLLGIEIIRTNVGQNVHIANWDDELLEVTAEPGPDQVFRALADRLEMTDRGRKLLRLYRRHRGEISELINRGRAVTVAWRRSEGPGFLAAVMRSAREASYRLPDELNGITRGTFAEHMRAAIDQYGSDALRADLQANSEVLLRLWVECSTLDEMFQGWEDDPAAIEAAE